MQSDWSQWEKYVVAELHRHQEDHRDIQKQLTQISIEIAALKVKSGVWGFVGAAIPVICGALYEILSRK